jgi:Adenylate and Guanylate cyclase catalytic domain
MLFADLVSSTERQSRMGDDASDEFRGRLFGALRHAAEQSRGDVIKFLGDGLMVVFRASTLDALTCALTMHDNAASLDPFDPPLLRIGISAGEVSEDGGDVFGMPVIEAARLCAAAQPSQTLATDVVRALIGNRGRFELAYVGDLELKGIPEPVTTVQLRRLGADATDIRLEPSRPSTDLLRPPAPAAAAFPPLPPKPPTATEPAARQRATAAADASTTAVASGRPQTSKSRWIAAALGGAAIAALAIFAISSLGGADDQQDAAASVETDATPQNQAQESTPSAPTQESADAAPTEPAVEEPTNDSAAVDISVAAPSDASAPLNGPAGSSEPAPFPLADQIVDLAFYPGVTRYVFTFEVPAGTQITVYWTSSAETIDVPIAVTIDRPVGEDIELNVLGFDATDQFTGTDGVHTITVEAPADTVGAGQLQVATSQP